MSVAGRYVRKTAREIKSGTWHGKNLEALRRYLRRTRGSKCETCNLESWLGDAITLEVHHIDGNWQNNNLSNIRLICPNCHSLTPTYRSKNNGNGKPRKS